MTDLLYLLFLSLIPLASLRSALNYRYLIVGGDTVTIKDYPYFASIKIISRTHGISMCSGAIIGRKWIISAAHCFWRADTEPRPRFQVAVGLDRYSHFHLHRVPLANVYPHPEFSESNEKPDIALVQLSTELQFNETVAKLSLPQFKEEYNAMQQDTMVSVVGFGNTQENGDYSEKLRGIDVKILNDNKCDVMEDSFDRNIHLCAGTLDGSKDACHGDSGSPLVYKKSEEFVLLGLVSFGAGCGQAGYPGGYMRVSAFLDWIKETINDAEMKNKSF